MKKSDSNVDRVYETLRRMAADFEFKPDERINESALSSRLGASRTPLREALNRLVAEGFLTFSAGRGFFCRSLSPQKILDLYEARVAVEAETARLAASRASEQALAELVDYLDQTQPGYDLCDDPAELLTMDEAFHMKIAETCQNEVLVAMLRNLNDRVRYVRLINLQSLQSSKPVPARDSARLSMHREILNAIVNRDETGAARAMRTHIERRREEATQAVQIAYSRLYVPND